MAGVRVSLSEAKGTELKVPDTFPDGNHIIHS